MSAVNICGAGPYIYNLDGLNSRVYRYSGTGTDVLVLVLSNWDGPYDLIGDDNGNFYVLYTNSGFQKLAKYSPAGSILCTYSLIGLPSSSSGAGYAIVGNKLYMSGGSGNYVGTISGTTITFTGLAGIPATIGDFASCPFPQLSSGISNPNNLTCSNLSTVLTATTSVTGPSYSWSGPGVTSGNGTNAVTVNQPGVYTVVITGSGGACPGASTSTINVTQSGVPPAASASSSGVVTCNNSSINLSASPGGMNYSWAAPAGSSITSGSTSQNATGSGGGTYTVTVTDPIGGCSSSNVVTVSSNQTPPSVSASAGGVLTCSTPNVTLSGSSGSAVNYSWSGPGIVSGATTANPSVNQPGTYNLTVTDQSNGCTANTSVGVTQNITPPSASAAAASGSVLNCNITSLALSGSPSSGVSYSWSGPGIISGSTSSSPTVNQPGTYNLVVTNTSNGCSNASSPASVVITQNITNPSPTASAASGGVLNCNVTSLSLSGTPASGVSYSWSGPGITSGGNTSNPTVNQPGTYNLVVTDNSNGCSNASSPASVLITQNITNPSATASASGGSALSCSTPTFTLTGTPSSGVNYSWTGPGIVSGGTTASPIINAAGTYSLVVTDLSNGCTNASSPAAVAISQSTVTISGTASTNSVVTCSSTNIDLNCTPAGYTYTWTAPAGSTINSGINAQNATGSGGGTYTVSIRDSNTGCFTTATILIPQNTTPPAGVSASANGSITCSTATVALSSTPNSGVSYSWSGPGIVSGGTTANPVVNQPGTYTLIVTNDGNGCSNSSSPTTVIVPQDAAIPIAMASVSGSLTCSATSLSLTGNTSSSSTYNWSGPGIVSGATSTSPIINQPGNYVYVVTNTVSGCSNSTTVTVPQNTMAPSPIVASTGNNTLTCNTTVLTLTASPSSGVTYNWAGPGIVSGGTTANPVINQQGTYSLTVTDNTNGCSNSTPAVLTISQTTIAPNAVASTANSSSITCTTPSVTLNASPPSGVSYNWTGPGIVSGGNTASPLVNQPGNYSLTVTDNITGCSNTIGSSGSVITIDLNNTPPVAQINAATAGSITCTNTMVTIDGTASTSGANISYTWTTSGTGSISGNSGTNLPTVTGAGDYTLTVTNTVNGCSDTETITITSNVALPNGVSAGSNVLLPCDSGSVILNGNSSNSDVSYLWIGPNSYTFAGQNASGVSIAGTYTLLVTDNVTGCMSSDSTDVIDQSVTASFTTNQNSGVAPLPVDFINTSTGASNYIWDFNDGHTSVLTDPSNTFESPGTYSVIMVAFNSAGTCSAVATQIIIVEDPFLLEVPNVFTPNGDGVNDVFTIKSKGIKEITLQIYNRWGQKMYEFSGPKASWDGLTVQGTEVPEATYFYFIKAAGFDSQLVEQQGTVNLFR
jgi:gliding motility-associated-like protein